MVIEYWISTFFFVQSFFFASVFSNKEFGVGNARFSVVSALLFLTLDKNDLWMNLYMWNFLYLITILIAKTKKKQTNKNHSDNIQNKFKNRPLLVDFLINNSIILLVFQHSSFWIFFRFYLNNWFCSNSSTIPNSISFPFNRAWYSAADQIQWCRMSYVIMCEIFWVKYFDYYLIFMKKFYEISFELISFLPILVRCQYQQCSWNHNNNKNSIFMLNKII